MRFRLATKPTWPDLRARLLAELPAAFPTTRFTFSAAGDEPLIGWHEGPAEGSVAAVVGEVAGWRVESSMLGPDPDAPPGQSVLRFRRTFSDATLALAVVRYHACSPRPYEPGRPGATERLWAILEEDDPASSGYPLTDAIRDLLVAAPDPDGEPPSDPAARWAWKLTRVGYDRLWATAWATVEL